MNPALRAHERHDFWPPFVLSLVGLILVFCGARHLTAIETVDGSSASEVQLIKAYSSGGLRYPEAAPPPPPPPRAGDASSAVALERWARQSAEAKPPTWKVRVDTAAATPCPT